MGNTARTSNLTICFWVEQRDILERAAANARDAFGRPMSISDWMRKRIMPIACQELGITLPRFPEFGRRGGGESGVYRAASMLGVTVKEFEKDAARKVAEQILDAITAPGTPTGPVSDTMPSTSYLQTAERRR